MPSLGMLRRVALVRTDVSEECSSSIITVTRIGYVGTTLAVTSKRRKLRIISMQRDWLLVIANVFPTSTILVTLIMEALRSSETSVLKRSTGHRIPKDGILHSYRRKNSKSYLFFSVTYPGK
jgi:hypothetical protein